MPGKTQMDQRRDTASKGGMNGGWEPRKRLSDAGGGHARRGERRDMKNINSWGGLQQQRRELEQPRGRWRPSGTGGEAGWGNDRNAWDTNPNDSASAWADEPLYTAAEGWDVSEPKIETMEDLLRSLALHSDDFKKDLIPFFLRSVAAAENEEPEVKLESFLEEKIQARKASGWYWSGSESEKKDGDGWSNHKASDNGWGAGEGDGWGAQNARDGWGQRKEGVPRDDGWDTTQSHKPNPPNNHRTQWHSRRPHNGLDLMDK